MNPYNNENVFPWNKYMNKMLIGTGLALGNSFSFVPGN
jgi:hypothetical protein